MAQPQLDWKKRVACSIRCARGLHREDKSRRALAARITQLWHFVTNNSKAVPIPPGCMVKQKDDGDLWVVSGLNGYDVAWGRQRTTALQAAWKAYNAFDHAA